MSMLRTLVERLRERKHIDRVPGIRRFQPRDWLVELLDPSEHALKHLTSRHVQVQLNEARVSDTATSQKEDAITHEQRKVVPVDQRA